MPIRYTDKEKAEALAIVDMQGGNVNAAARLTGVPQSTLERWASGERVNQNVEALRISERKPLSDLIEDLAYDIVDAVKTNGSLKRSNARDLLISLGIAVDKIQLLRGQPTSITENLLSDEARAERVAILLEQARQRQLTSQPAGDTIPGSLTTSADNVSHQMTASHRLL